MDYHHISSASQYSSASESGWTHYLDQSSLSENYFQRRGGVVDECEGKGARMEEESEEDLSMVSDASSGPPHYDNECYCENWYPCLSSTTKEQQKKKVKEYGRSQQPSPLDDTASSSLFNFPKESHKKQECFSGNGAVESALDFSQCVSATRIKRKTKFQKHFSFLERSLGGKLASKEQGGFDGEGK